eukprot:10413696-Prorocentrum_lima.AAC.1
MSEFLKNGDFQTNLTSQERTRILGQSPLYVLHEDMLFRLLPPANRHEKGTRFLLVVPKGMKEKVLTEFHECKLQGHP